MKKILIITASVCLFLTVQAQQFADIKLTEIMYNAPVLNVTVGDSVEFVELKNTGAMPINLSGAFFSAGIAYTFPQGSTIDTGGFVVLTSDTTAYKLKYPGVGFFDQYNNVISNKGERLAITAGVDTFINVTYNDNYPWPILADGNGFSLVSTQINPTGNQNKSTKWRASTAINGSPNADDPTLPNYPKVIVNELLSHTGLPQRDAVEIYNASSSAIDISGWYMSDDRNKLSRYVFPNGTIINANSYFTVDEDVYNINNTGFSFNRTGETVSLVAVANGQLTGYAHGWKFGAQYNGTAFGVHTTSENEDHFVAQQTVTLNAVNSVPKINPIVFTEIMYNPTVLEDEYIVLKNRTDSTVNLYSYQSADTTWKVSGVGFKFPSNFSMTSQSKVILTEIDSASFRIKYNIPSSTPIFQYLGKLSNQGEKISLKAPARLDTVAGIVTTPYILIESVEYNNKLPWNIDANGLGSRLVRKTDTEYGNDPINWQAGSGAIIVSVNEINGATTQLVVYPNPFTFQTTIYFPEKGIKSYQIIDITGKKVQSGQFESNTFTWNKNNLPAGIYMLEVKSNTAVKYAKLIVN